MRQKIDFADSSSDDELHQELHDAAARERRKNPHGMNESSIRTEAKTATSGKLSSTNRKEEGTGVVKSLFSSSSSSDDEDDEKGHHKESSAAQSDDSGPVLSINKEYAAKYDVVKRQKELHRLTSKYGSKYMEDEEDEEEDEEDDEAVLLTKEKELAFAKALYAVKHPEKAKKSVEPIFSSPEEQLEYNTRVFEEAMKVKNKKKKLHTLADEYQRSVKVTAEGEDAPAVDNTSGAKRLVPRSEKEKALRDAFLKSAEEVGDFSATRKDPPSSTKAGVGNREGDDDDPTSAEAKKLLMEAFGDTEENEEEAFIKTYFLKELWKSDGTSEGEVDYKALAEAEEQEMFYDDAEVWEHKYQERKYRHEEDLEQVDHVQTFPRPIGEAAEGLLRKHDTTRKDARQRRLERIAEARQRQVEELKRLKHLKRQEIDHQRALIASVSGLSRKSGATAEEKEEMALARLKDVWSEKDFDAPFDPVEFDKKMASIFNDDYYNEDNMDDEEMQYMEAELDGTDEDEEEDKIGEGRKKAQLKALADDPDLFNAESVDAAKEMEEQQKTKKKKIPATDFLDAGSAPHKDRTLEDPLDILYPSASLHHLEDASFQKRRELEHATAQGASEELLEKLKRELREKEEAYLQLHHVTTDSMPFRYREVPQEDFTLSVEEILARDDRQLNMIAPMNCYAAYLDKFSNERDRRRIEARRRKGLREIGPERGSRRYRNVSSTAVLDESISEKEGLEIAERLEKKLKEKERDEYASPHPKKSRKDYTGEKTATASAKPYNAHKEKKQRKF